MKKCMYIFLILAFSLTAKASDLDVLIAKTALALGDEYGKIATSYQIHVKELMKINPTSIVSAEEDISPDLKNALDNYDKYLALSLSEYSVVVCENNCPPPIKNSGLELTTNYNFLRREAFVKFSQLSVGSNSYGQIGKYSTIYAVNSNFEEHLLGKLSRLVETQQRLDTEARKVQNNFSQLESSYVDLDNEQIVGVDQAILREQNYSLDAQTQISGYQGCIASESMEDNFEKDEMVKSISQYEILVKNLKNNFNKIYSYVYQNSAGSDLFTISANQGWTDTGAVFNAGDRAYLDSTGIWVVRGAVMDYQDSHLYFSPPENVPKNIGPDKGIEGWSCCKIKVKISIKDIITFMVHPVVALHKSVIDKYILPKPAALKALSESNQEALERIRKGLDAKPDGYYFSFGTGATEGVSEGTSVNGGVSFFGVVNIGGGKNWGESSGVSTNTGGTYGLKLNTTVFHDAPVGALIGSFCNTIPDGTNCKYFLVGSANVVDVPEDQGSLKLWLRANEHPTNFTFNKGALQVKVQKQVAFKNYWDQYRSWFDKECDANGYNCGLAAILDNIAYVPDPYTVARSALVKEFPEFPEEVTNLILQEVNSIIELLLAGKELESKELSRELHSTKIATCKDQLQASQEKLANTRELISTYQRRQQNVNTKKILLDTSKRYYESELAAINSIREKNLERIKRYYALTISSYNYLYLDDLKLEGESQPYFEGDYYKSQIDLMEDLILEITTVNDLLNPNRGFVVYQLSNEELKGLQHPDYRQRKSGVRIDYNQFFCQGFDLENQARVMIEKVGILLDIDPTKEHLFFKNPNKRNTQVQLAHGLENRFYSFDGTEKEYWMPAQKRNVAGYSTRVLVDSNSDYFQLRDSRFFERLSFRKTSFASSWQLDMFDPAILMYDSADTSFQNPLLKGVKLVFWFNSAELQGDQVLNQCLISPIDVQVSSNPIVGGDISWKFPKADQDFNKVERFTVYRSSHSEHGFKPVGHLNVSECVDSGNSLDCNYNDPNISEGSFFYQVRSSYLSRGEVGSYLDGVSSQTVNLTLAKK